MITSSHYKKGFTLIEMMVAVSIFVVVALIVTSTFITIVRSYRQTEALHQVIDNVNFAMDSIAFNLREGREYMCPIVQNGGTVPSCTGQYYPAIAFKGGTVANPKLYVFEQAGDTIQMCTRPLTTVEAATPITLLPNPFAGGCPNFVNLTSDQVKINSFAFYEPGTWTVPHQRQIMIYISGVAIQGTNKTPFILQTAASQRNQ